MTTNELPDTTGPAPADAIEARLAEIEAAIRAGAPGHLPWLCSELRKARAELAACGCLRWTAESQRDRAIAACREARDVLAAMYPDGQSCPLRDRLTAAIDAAKGKVTP